MIIGVTMWVGCFKPIIGEAGAGDNKNEFRVLKIGVFSYKKLHTLHDDFFFVSWPSIFDRVSLFLFFIYVDQLFFSRLNVRYFLVPPLFLANKISHKKQKKT